MCYDFTYSSHYAVFSMYGLYRIISISNINTPEFAENLGQIHPIEPAKDKRRIAIFLLLF